MNDSSRAALLFAWWQEQSSFNPVIPPQEPLTAAGSDGLPVPVSEQGGLMARPLLSWGEALAGLDAAAAAGPGSTPGAPASPMTAVPADPEPGGSAASLQERLRDWRAPAQQPQASAGGAGLPDQSGRAPGQGGTPQCNCAICQGMAVGARRDLIDLFGRSNSQHDRQSGPVSQRWGAMDLPQQPASSAAPLASGGFVATALNIADADVFNLQTNPGASKTIYLNFLGANLSGTAWIPAGSSWNGVAPAFTLDSDTSTNFSAAELAAIKEIFARVACDYAPFNVNVTTIAPSADAINRSSSSDSVYGTSCLFSNISTETNFSNAGGVAYVGVFNSVNAEYYKPALVFPSQLANGAKYIAEAASHEIGHNLGLSHDGTSTTGYYSGQGSSPGWAPIMGVGYYKPLTQFSRGTYADANNKENDFSVIAGEGVGYWADSVGNSRSAAASLNLTDSNADGISDTLRFGGTIELTSSDGLGVPDQDFYSLLAPSNGSVTINIRNALSFFNPAAAQYTFAPVPSGYGNLRLDARLEDAAGTVLADWSNNASLDVSNFTASGLIAGQNYYLSVLANASSPDGEDTYGSLGDYVVDLVYQGQPPAANTPSVSLSLASASVLENSGSPLVYTFSRSGPTDAALTVNFTVSGTATAGSDYTGAMSGPGSVQIAAGQSTATLQLTPVGDTTFEADETVVISLASSVDYSLVSPSSVTGTILNDDLPPPTYALSSPSLVQEGQTLPISISTTNLADGTILNWRFSGAAVTADDFSPASLAGSVTVSGAAATLSPLITSDNEIESTETALFELLNGSTVVASRSISLVDTNRLWGTTGSDTITGSAGRLERITGVLASGTTASSLGSGQRDTVTGGAGADEFLLSEVRSGSLRVFYNDNTNNNTGTLDFLRITDFNPTEDKLRFGGGRYFSANNGSETWIWYDRNNNGSLNTTSGQNSSDELVAVINGLNLGSNTMVSGSSTNPGWVVFG